eukprot:1174165-Prorocentrum_minimum.AAC.1
MFCYAPPPCADPAEDLAEAAGHQPVQCGRVPVPAVHLPRPQGLLHRRAGCAALCVDPRANRKHRHCQGGGPQGDVEGIQKEFRSGEEHARQPNEATPVEIIRR